MAAVFGVAAGGGGISSALPDDKNSRAAIGITSLVIGMASAGVGYLASTYADDFEKQCNQD